MRCEPLCHEYGLPRECVRRADGVHGGAQFHRRGSAGEPVLLERLQRGREWDPLFDDLYQYVYCHPHGITCDMTYNACQQNCSPLNGGSCGTLRCTCMTIPKHYDCDGICVPDEECSCCGRLPC